MMQTSDLATYRDWIMLTVLVIALIIGNEVWSVVYNNLYIFT